MDAPHSDRAARVGRVPAWDGPTRLFKWGLVLLVACAWLSQHYADALGDTSLRWHRYNGYAILVLVVFRVLWGLVGASTARFATWLYAPWTAIAYLARALSGRGRPYLGHNPAGAWMVLALLALAAGQAGAGLFTADSNGLFGGPFANTDPTEDATRAQALLSTYHLVWGFWILLGFAAVHVLVNLTYQFGKREPIITAMVTGVKPAADYADAPAMQPAPAAWLRALACLALALVVVLGGIKLGGGRLG
jgi:cytochrome b